MMNFKMSKEGTCTVKIENAEEDYKNSLGESFSFTTLDDMMITEVLVDHLLNELDQIKDSIKTYKSKCRLFEGTYRQIYRGKKALISKYIKCDDKKEKSLLKEELVSLFCYSTNPFY